MSGNEAIIATTSTSNSQVPKSISNSLPLVAVNCIAVIWDQMRWHMVPELDTQVLTAQIWFYFVLLCLNFWQAKPFLSETLRQSFKLLLLIILMLSIHDQYIHFLGDRFTWLQVWLVYGFGSGVGLFLNFWRDELLTGNRFAFSWVTRSFIGVFLYTVVFACLRYLYPQVFLVTDRTN